MVKVAISGAGGLGRTILDVLKQTAHEAVILSREDNPDRAKTLGVPIVVVDYDDVDSTSKALEENNVHTVISTIRMNDDSTSLPQLNLIRAAEKSKTTKRFIPSEWGMPWTQNNERIFPAQAGRRAAYELLKNETKLEYTRFEVGFFMDYFGMPNIKSNMLELSLCIDFAARFAALPGDGSNQVCWSYTGDIAQYVVRYLDVPEGQWEETVFVSSDKKSFNEVLAIGEKVTGEKFQVVYDAKGMLEKGEVTELPSYVQVYQFFPKEIMFKLMAMMKLLFVENEVDLDMEKTINRRYPDIKPKTVEDIVKEGWGK